MGKKQLEVLLDEMPEIIFGAEGEENTSGSDSGDSTDESSDSSDSSDESARSSSDSSQQSTNNDDNDSDDDEHGRDTRGLKSALQSERKERKRLEKELRNKQKAEEDRELSEKDEIEQYKVKEQRATERSQRLANGLLRRDLDDAIRRAAESQGYIDVGDAIDGVDRSKLAYEQDEDDPTDITIDEKVIAREVKNLATKKPHFLKRGTDDGEPSGNSYGGRRQKKNNAEEEYRKNYPSLN